MAVRLIMKLRVDEAVRTSPDVLTLRLVHPRRPRLPAWEAGAHVDVHLPDHGVRQYSLCSDAGDPSHYRIAVKRDPAGRGGSAWIHRHLEAGAEIPVSAPRNHFPLQPGAHRFVLVAGGIGITPLYAMARTLVARDAEFVLHYCVRNRQSAPLLGELQYLCGDRLRLWNAKAGGRFDAAAALSGEQGADFYVCGPARLTDAVAAAAQAAGLPEERFHCERFAALSDADFVPEAFHAVRASTGETIAVPADRSLLSVLKEQGVDIESSCEIGVCGACECGYLEGEIVHRDVVLSPAAGKSRMMPCVSRARGKVVLDL